MNDLISFAKRLVKLSDATGLDFASYADHAHKHYKFDFIFRWFQISLYRDVYPEKEIPARPVLIKRMVVVTLPLDALVPIDLLLGWLATSPKLWMLAQAYSELFKSYNSFEQAREPCDNIQEQVYAEVAAKKVRARLRPLLKRLVYCGPAKGSQDLAFIFSDEDVKLLDILAEQYQLPGVEGTTIWAISRHKIDIMDEIGYGFYNAQAESIEVPQLALITHKLKGKVLSEQILPVVRKTRLAQLIA